MKKIATVILLGMSLLVGCENIYRDELAQMHKEIFDMNARLDAFCNETNANIAALQTMIAALQAKDYVTGVVPVIADGKEVGYQITFDKSGKVTIYHGKDGANGADGANGKDGKDGYTPKIGVKLHTDGLYYWTLDGEWLTDENGNMVKAVGVDGEDGKDGQDGSVGPQGPQGEPGKDAIAPQLKIEDGNWYISVDGGNTWDYVGQATGDAGQDGATGPQGPQGEQGLQGDKGDKGDQGDSIFSDIDITEEYVIITLADGKTQIILPTWAAFNALKTQVDKLNADMQALQALVAAWEANDYVKSVTALPDGSGYMLTFVHSGTITIYHGKDGSNGSDGAPGQDGSNGTDGKDGHTPVISVEKDTDGVWYWTIDGEWLLDSNGNKVKAVGTDGQDGTNGSNGSNGTDGINGKDGVTPRFKIENGMWYVSYDEGQTWELAGQATGNTGGAGEDGDSLFAAVDSSNEDFIVVVLTDGRTLKFPTWAAFEELKALCNQMNTNLSSLQTLVNSSDYVTGVSEIWDNGEVIGYTISFTKSNPVVIYHGKNGKDGADGTPGQDGEDGKDGKDGYVPNIGLKQDTDGVWYWTLDGDWMLDSNGQRVKASGKDGADGSNGSNGTNGQDGQNGVTPRLKIENGYWYISYDNGSSWELVGQATGDKGDVGETGPEGSQGPAGEDGEDGKDGDTLISGIEITDDYVLITLADGQVIRLSTWNAKAEIEEILSMIQSVTYMPEYYDGAAYVDRARKEVEMNFKISPSSVVLSIEKVWETALSAKSITTMFTKSIPAMNDITIKSAQFDNTIGIISLCLDCSDLEDSFYLHGTSASVALFISDGKNNISSDFIPLRLHSIFEDAIDLSAPEAANSYVVSEPGAYMFKTVKGNSSESVGQVYSGEVVWESFGTSTTPSVGDLIRYVSYEDGYIAFQTPDDFKEGNALVAAKDASGTILWSWHIWLTDEPQGQVYYNGAGTMMDRNLGATSVTPGDVCALGLMYQWGRKDPFLGPPSTKINTNYTNLTASSTIIWPSPGVSNSSNGTIEYATAHPTTFIMANSDNHDWYYTGSSSADNTRWTTSDENKSIYDPCPAGWRVPDGGSDGVWSRALGSTTSFQDRSLTYENNDGLNFSNKFGSDLTIGYPASGFIRHDGYLTKIGYLGTYWSASPYDGDTYHAHTLFFDARRAHVTQLRTTYRAYGIPVRCIKEGTTSSTEYVNLSEHGSANSYIVSKKGNYKFIPTKGNSNESVGDITSAETLWESFGTDVTPNAGDLVTNVKYENGVISFATPITFREGNAVIAAKDASGTILWSWHIWLTDEPEEQVYYNDAGTMMDRNLGATSANPGDVAALGLMYQWGRKDPFLGASSITTNSVAKSTITWPSAVTTDVNKGTVSYVTANPTTFVNDDSDSSQYDWHYTSRDNTLWSDSDKTKSIYDPCPVGWRVPDGNLWSKALGLSSYFTDSSLYDTTNQGVNFSGKFGSDPTIWYPAAGFDNPDIGGLHGVGFQSDYWSASANGQYSDCMYFYSDGRFGPITQGGRSSGKSIRCQKEDNSTNN